MALLEEYAQEINLVTQPALLSWLVSEKIGFVSEIPVGYEWALANLRIETCTEKGIDKS